MALAAQDEKLIVTDPSTTPPGAMFPTANGSEVRTTGLHAVPAV